MRNFCRAGHLSALLKEDQFPEALKPYTARVESLFDPHPAMPRKLSNSTLEPVDSTVLFLMKDYLNNENQDGCQWVLPHEWCTKSESQTEGVSAIPPRAFFYNQVDHSGVPFSTFTGNPNNSFVTFKSRTSKKRMFGRIFSIMLHHRSPKPSQNLMDTWLLVQSFPSLPKSMFDPMSQVDSPDVQVHLRAWSPTENVLIKLQEVIAHCSWIMYKAHGLHNQLSYQSVALVSMER